MRRFFTLTTLAMLAIASHAACSADPADSVRVEPDAQPADAAPPVARPSVLGAWEFRRDDAVAQQRLGYIVESDRVRWLTHGQVTRDATTRVRENPDGSVTIEVTEGSGIVDSLDFIFVDGGIARAALPAIVYRPVEIGEALRASPSEFASAPSDLDDDGSGAGEGSDQVEGST